MTQMDISATCAKQFSPLRPNSQEHQAAHSGASKHQCTICHKLFRYRIGVTSHLKHVHFLGSVESPQVCPVCQKEFKCRQYLKKHMTVHSDKCFLCDICGKCFKSKEVLKRHHKTHDNPRVKRFVCAKCGHKFHTKEVQHHAPVHL